MKRKVLAIITALLVSGSVGAYAASSNISLGSLPTANTCPQNATVKTITAPASSSCPKSAAVSSAVQAVLNQAKPASSCPISGASASSKCNTASAVKAAAQNNNCANGNCTQNSACKANSCTNGANCTNGTCTAKQNCNTNSCTGGSCIQNSACKASSCTNGTTCPQTNCTQNSNCGKYIYVSGNSSNCNNWINGILNSICGKNTSGTTGTSSKPAATQSAAAASKPAASQTTTGSSYSAFQNEVVRLVNVERAKNGLSALSIDAGIMKTATIKSQDMAKNNYFSHTSPTYGSPFDLMKQYGVSYRAAGENIAMGQTSPAQVMNGWMNSPGHRANILNGSYTKIGVGVAQNANGTYYWTQHFIG